MDWLALCCVLAVIPSVIPHHHQQHQQRNHVSNKVHQLPGVISHHHHQHQQRNHIPSVIPHHHHHHQHRKHGSNKEHQNEPKTIPEVLEKNELSFDVPTKDIITERRRQILRTQTDIQSNELPESEPALPGHTLIQPNAQMFKSQAKFPQDNKKTLVYGNPQQVGIRYDDQPQRVMYSDFRKQLIDILIELQNQDKTQPDPERRLGTLLKILTNGVPKRPLKKKSPILYTTDIQDVVEFLKKRNRQREKDNYPAQIAIGTRDLNANDLIYRPLKEFTESKEWLQRSEETAGKEILYTPTLLDDLKNILNKDYRRDGGGPADEGCANNSTSEESEGSKSIEKNPGNPFTVFKDKYRQNWLWNHNMDGDHMNVNPYGPSFNSLGPSGAELFFNRKWWYFNQDDYKPFR